MWYNRWQGFELIHEIQEVMLDIVKMKKRKNKNNWMMMMVMMFLAW
jgi:hypothetical protein